MKVLLIYPKFPDSFWSFKKTLAFIGKRSSMPPLGLITVPALFPKDWKVKLIDMNIEELTEKDLLWADICFFSAMIVQRNSLFEGIRMARKAGCHIAVGGPYPTSYKDEIEAEVPKHIHYYFLGEVEEIIPDFINDLKNGSCKKIYEGPKKGDKPETDVSKSPTPRFELLNLGAYASMPIQWSRGCPFDCEFCDITALFGRIPRIKTDAQIIAELDALYQLGWRNSVFFVDDNFIGNKKKVLELLKSVIKWQRKHAYPFQFFTEASIDLANYPELLKSMWEARFTMVFVGIESPGDAALKKTTKGQNLGRAESASENMLKKIRKIQAAGLEVSGGFIIGLDGDTEFYSHIKFIENAGIPMAMVGLLTPLRQTKLWYRLEREGRLKNIQHTGNNTDALLSFVTQLPEKEVLEAYRKVISHLYGPNLKSYFDRCFTMIKNLGPRIHGMNTYRGRKGVTVLLRSLYRQTFSKHGRTYLWFLIKVLFKKPIYFPQAVEYAVKGFHFEAMTRDTLKSMR